MKESDFLILGMLHLQPTHPYELFTQLNNTSGIGLIWRFKRTNLYQDINTLQAQDLITHIVQKNSNRPEKKVYNLTKKGLEQFEQWVETPVQHGREIRAQFMAKLYFLRILYPERTELMITKQIKALRSECKRFVVKSTDTETEFSVILASYRLHQLNSTINWLEEIGKKRE